GDSVYVNINANGVFINNAQVIVADLLADNGVVHVINAVLLPDTNVVEYIDGCSNMNACNYDSTATLDNGTCFANGDACDDQDAATINDMYVDCACMGEIDLPNTVVDIIVNSADHDTLEAAVVAADLVGALSGTGPFTVFAPTDAAFAALPAGTIDALLADPTGPLTDILLYHVVGSQALSTDLSNGMTITTLEGSDVTVTIDANGVFINNAQVIVADLLADNGVVHVIDAVLLPPVAPVDGCTNMMACNYNELATADDGSCFFVGDACNDNNAATENDVVMMDCSCMGTPVVTNTVWDIIQNSPDHTTLELAIVTAGLDGALSGTGPFTVFAPTDAAFSLVDPLVIAGLLAD
ncbi:MAG: fasciclin domain-containing protein, partial [Flavobacteriales bacterium]